MITTPNESGKTQKPTLTEHTKLVEKAIEAMEEQAEVEFLERVRVFSTKFPNRVVSVIGGMGHLDVHIGRKGNAHADIIKRPYRWQWAGETVYTLSHGVESFTEHAAPGFMKKYRDELFGDMEKAEDECGNLYHFNPMVACGDVNFKNGERL